MSDEKKENVEAPKTENANATEETAAKKNKKIKLMNLKELEGALEKTQKNQGGLYSRYSRELVKRRDYLLSLDSDKS
ncbi:MAG: hypothetical protein KAT05_05005 [Spirochaetes bacterium]|nr:hypothetical protein [Spirochaetota bacterium]